MATKDSIKTMPYTDGATFFSSAQFCKLWANIYGLKWQGVGNQCSLGALYKPVTRLMLREYQLGPYGLYWGGTGTDLNLSKSFFNSVSKLRKQWNFLDVRWNVRYDERQNILQFLNPDKHKTVEMTEKYTHVLELERSYEQFYQTCLPYETRRKIHKANNSKLTIRELRDRNDFAQHERLYKSWASIKQIARIPENLFRGLVNEFKNSVSLLGAFKEEKLIAAILLFKHDREWFYWHGIRDAEYSEFYPTDLLFQYAIKNAFSCGVSYFNFGGSAGIQSLEHFKERWGAKRTSVLCLRWRNPIWNQIIRLWRKKGMS